MIPIKNWTKRAQTKHTQNNTEINNRWKSLYKYINISTIPVMLIIIALLNDVKLQILIFRTSKGIWRTITATKDRVGKCIRDA